MPSLKNSPNVIKYIQNSYQKEYRKMITVNNNRLCEYCFARIDAEPCSECGFDKASYRFDPIALRLGSVLANRYLIGGVIGKGGFGITYLAYDLKLDTRLAVKEYYPMGLALRTPGSTSVSVTNEESEENFRSGAEKFYNEAKMVARFNGNLNIVSVHDFFYENATVYFTMGYLQGETLKSYLKRSLITEGQALAVMQDVSNALMLVHSAKILHRDISPDNIMLCDDGSVKLLDFGAARQVMAERSQSLSIILKQGFAPLEQYQKRGKQGPWTDIYALGATIYNALTGQLLDDPMSRLEDDGAITDSDHGISGGLWNILQKCISLHIEDRYQDVFELKRDLNALDIETELIEVKVTGTVVRADEHGRSFGGVTHEVDGNSTELLYDKSDPMTRSQSDVTTGENHIPAGSHTGEPASNHTYEPAGISPAPPGSNTGIKVLIGLAAAIVLLLGIAIGLMVTGMAGSKNKADADTLTEAVTETIDNTENAVSADAFQQTGPAEEIVAGEDEDTSAPDEVKDEDLSGKAEDAHVPEGEAEVFEEETSGAEPSDEEISDQRERFIDISYAEATSELEVNSVDNSTYHASNVKDGDYTTAWIDGVDGSAVGQVLTLHLDKEHEITRLVIFNGFLKTKYRYTVNGKVTRARIDLGGRRTGDHNIRVMEPGLDNIPFRRNELSPTEIVLDEPVRTDTIKIGILGDIPGIKYYDTAISEIEVYGIN